MSKISWSTYIELIHHKWAVPCGWWTNLETGERIDRSWAEIIALIHSELSEALEGDRKNLMDDKLPHRKMCEVEMADTAIRICDAAGGFGISLDNLSVCFNADLTNADKIAELHECTTHLFRAREHNRPYYASQLLAYIDAFCEDNNYSLEDAIYQKMEYNRHRADHKIENRVADGGKKY